MFHVKHKYEIKSSITVIFKLKFMLITHTSTNNNKNYLAYFSQKMSFNIKIIKLYIVYT